MKVQKRAFNLKVWYLIDMRLWFVIRFVFKEYKVAGKNNISKYRVINSIGSKQRFRTKNLVVI